MKGLGTSRNLGLVRRRQGIEVFVKEKGAATIDASQNTNPDSTTQ